MRMSAAETNSMERPWRRDKQSWIFYIDQIKEDENIVYGEADGNMFLLDCETASLSIWSEHWGVFTEVGISGLLRRMSNIGNESSRDILGGTRILYKGIELQNRCLADDIELLEFIDIHGELGKSFISISRNSFTEEGERFFKEVLYPELMDVIRQVLRALAKLSEGKEEEKSFSKKISSIVKEMCDEIVKNEEKLDDTQILKKEKRLISLVGTVAVLSYFAMRDEWNMSESLKGKYRDKVWENLVGEIDGILSSPSNRQLIEDLGVMTSLFGIKAYREGYQQYIVRGKRIRNEENINFLKIFLKDRHWAVLQCRRDGYSNWVLHLILLDENGKTEVTDVFQKLITIPRPNEAAEELERWWKEICNIPEEFFEVQSDKQQILLKWLLKNIPTVGMFSNEQGNVRLNVLSGRVYPSIFLNKNFKCLILERMMEKAQKDSIRRFSTVTWQGGEYNSCRELPFAVYFIKRGCFSDYSYHKSIVPFDGELLGIWKQALEDTGASELVHQVDKLLGDMDIVGYLKELQEDNENEEYKNIREYLRNSPTNSALEIAIDLLDILLARIKKIKYKKEINIQKLLVPNENRLKSWHKIYCIIAEFHAAEMDGNDNAEQSRNLIERIMDSDEINSLCSAWLYCCIFQEDLVGTKSEIKGLYEEYMSQHPESANKDEKIANYIKNNKHDFDIETIRHCMEEYKEELLCLVQELETRQIRQYLVQNMRRYRSFTVRLTDEYVRWEKRNKEEGRTLEVADFVQNN